MRRFIISALVLSGMTANAQVKDGMIGINTDEPRATMHIEPGVSESKGAYNPAYNRRTDENHDQSCPLWGRPPRYYHLSKRNSACGRPHRQAGRCSRPGLLLL